MPGYPWSRVLARAIGATVLGIAWASLCWIKPFQEITFWNTAWYHIDRVVVAIFGVTDIWFWVAKSYVMVAVLLVVLMLLGGRPKAMGLGRMTPLGWRIVGAAFAVALPFLIALGLTPGIQQYYGFIWQEPGGISYLLACAAFMVVEHAAIEGAILSLALPDGGVGVPVQDAPRRGRLAFVGLGNTEGGKGISDWLGIPTYAWPALIGQALIFALIHWGKHPAEIASAFPGGLGLGMLTYRIRSVWATILLHIGTGAVIVGVAYLASFR
jgi:membrane protease YdiL (CAAX protease family)